MRFVATAYARFVGLVVFLYGGWMFGVNLVDSVIGDNGYDPSWIVYVILLFGAVGVAGAMVFLLSLDGPQRWRTRTRRVIGWTGMILCLLLPTSISFFLLPLAGLAALTLALKNADGNHSEQPARSA